MCRCTPEIRTPFCGKPGCEFPRQVLYYGYTGEDDTLLEFFDEFEAFQWQYRFRDKGFFLLKRIVLKVEVA